MEVLPGQAAVVPADLVALGDESQERGDASAATRDAHRLLRASDDDRAPDAMTFPASFETARLVAHRLDASHYDDLRRLQTNAGYMAELGGVRTEEQTRAYLAT